MKIVRALLICVFSIVSITAFAADPPNDPELETRAREIGRSLRCVVCQNQSIEDSDAVLAEDMRTLVRTRLKAGDSDEQVVEFMHNRYGDFVLLKPPVQTNTYILWFTPFILLLIFLVWYVVRARRKPSSSKIEIQPLSDEEKERLERLLEPEE